MAEPQEVIVLQCGQPTSVSIVNGNIVVTVFDRKSITLVNLLGGGTEGDSLKTFSVEGSPYAAASARSPGGESVLFVASGASITGLRLPVPPLTSDAVAVETLQQPTPFTSFATSGEARGLHACGRYLFLADNAGLRYYDIASESNKLHALTEATLSLFEALGVSNLGRVTCIQSLPLSDTPDSLSNIVLFVVCDGKIAVVEAHPLSTPVAILLPLPSSSPSPLRVSFSPSPPSALFLACTDGEAVYRADLDVREIMECIQRGKATPAAVRSTPVRGSGGSRGGKKAAEKPKAPIPTLSITPEVYAQWAGPTGTPRDLLVTPDGLLFGCKNTPGGEGRVSVFGPEGSLPSLPFRAFSGATRVNTSSASPQRALMSPFRGLNTSAISTRSSPDQVTFAGDSLSVKHPPVGLHMQLMKALQCASKWEAEAHYLRAKERDSGGLLTVECDRLRVRLGESDFEHRKAMEDLTASLERDKKKAVDDEKAKSANEILRLTRSNTANEEHISLLKDERDGLKAEVASSRALAQELTQKTVALTTSQASVAALQAEVAALKSADEAMLKEKSDALARSDAEKAGVNLKLQEVDSAYQELRAIIPTLEGQVAKLSAQLQSCEAEKNSLRAQLTATESQLASAESKLATSQAQLTAANQLNSKLQSDLQATGSDSARIAEELRSEAGDLKAQLDAQAAKLLASETGIAALTSELSTLTGRFADAEATIASQAKLIDAAAGETSALLREKQALEDQLTEASAREDVLSAEVSTLMQQLADRVDASELDSAKAEIVSLLSQLEAHAALQEENKRLSTELETLAGASKDLGNTTTDLLSSVETLTAENKQLKSDLQGAVGQLQAQFDELEYQRRYIADAEADRDAQYAKFIVESGEVAKRYAELAESNQKMEAELRADSSKAIEGRQQLEIELAASRERLQSLSVSLAAAESAQVEQAKQLSERVTELEFVKASLSAHVQLKADLERENEALKATIRDLTTSQDALSSKISEAEQQIAAITEDKDVQLAKLQQEMLRLKASNAKASAGIESLKAEFEAEQAATKDQHSIEIARLQAEVASKNTELTQCLSKSVKLEARVKSAEERSAKEADALKAQLTSDLSEARAEIDRLAAEIATLQPQLEKAQREASELLAKDKKNTTRLQVLTELFETTKASLVSAEAQLEDQKLHEESLQQELSAVSAELRAKELALINATTALHAQEQVLADAKKSHEAKVEVLEKRLEAAVASSEGSQQEFSGKLSEANEKLAAALSSVSEKQAVVSALQKDVIQREKDLSVATKTIKTLRDTVEALESSGNAEKSKLEKELEDVTSKFLHSKDLVKKKKELAESLSTELEALKAEYAQLSQTNAARISELEELTDSRTSELALLQNRLNIAQAGLEAEKASHAKLQEAVAKSKAAVTAKGDEIVEVQVQLAHAKRVAAEEAEKSARELEACRTRIAELKAENESLRAELTSAKALLNDPATRDAVGRLTKSLEELREKEAALRVDYEKKLEEAESLRKQLDGVQRRTSDLDSAALREQKEKAAASERAYQLEVQKGKRDTAASESKISALERQLTSATEKASAEIQALKRELEVCTSKVETSKRAELSLKREAEAAQQELEKLKSSQSGAASAGGGGKKNNAKSNPKEMAALRQQVDEGAKALEESSGRIATLEADIVRLQTLLVEKSSLESQLSEHLQFQESVREGIAKQSRVPGFDPLAAAPLPEAVRLWKELLDGPAIAKQLSTAGSIRSFATEETSLSCPSSPRSLRPDVSRQNAIALAPLLLGNISPPTTSDGSESRTFLAVVNRAVSRLLIQNQGFLAAVKEQYDSPGGTMPFANVLKLVTEFKLYPELCTVEDVRAIFDAVNKGEDADADASSLDQLEFNEFIVRLAILHCPDASITFPPDTDFVASTEFGVAVFKLLSYMHRNGPADLIALSPSPKKTLKTKTGKGKQ